MVKSIREIVIKEEKDKNVNDENKDEYKDK
jgi:hypothetical protein